MSFCDALSPSEYNYTDESLQECCAKGFSLIPMRRTCEERAQRISLIEGQSPCVEVFLHCCREGERLRRQKMKEDARKGLGRSKLYYLFEGVQRYVTKTLFSRSQLQVSMTSRSSFWTRLLSTSGDISLRALPSRNLMLMTKDGK